MLCAICILAVVLTAFLTAWAALIVQSLAGGGDQEPFFASQLDFHCPIDDDYIVILDDYFTFVDSNGVRHIAAKGMHSDGASVGFLLCIPIIGTIVARLIKGTPLTGPLRPAGIAHDGLYARARESKFWPALISGDRAIADRVIYEAATCAISKDGAKVLTRRPLAKWRAFIVMAILRIGGFKAWIDDSVAARSLRSENRPSAH
jgi:hypothetical protein